VQMAATTRFKIFFIYESPRINASILFVAPTKHAGNGSRNHKSARRLYQQLGARL